MTSHVGAHPPVARRDRGVPRPAAGQRRDARSSPCARAARRWSAPSAVRAHRLRGLAQGRGRQPDRVVQGPRHDDGDLARRPRTARKAVICASTGNTSALAPRPTPSRPGMICAVLVPAGQDRARQARAGARARRQAAAGRRQLRRLPDAGPRARRRTTRSRWSTRSTRSASRGRRPRPSRSSTRSATPPTSTACRSATPATSPPTGRATASTPPTASRRAARGCGASRPPARRRSSAASRSRDPSTIATAIRIGNPASWTAGRRGARRVRRPDRRGHRRRDPRRVPAAGARSEGVFVEPASAASVAGLLQAHDAGPARPGPDASSARSPATASRTRSGRSPARPQPVHRRRSTPHAAAVAARPGAAEWRAPMFRAATGARPGARRPAPTSGPGFDAFGLALGALRRHRRRRSPTTGLDVEVAGEGAGQVPRDERHLVVTSMRAAFDALGGQPRGLAAALRQPHPARPRPGLVGRGDRRRARRWPARWSSAATSGCDDDALLRAGHRDRGPPGQRRRRAARRLHHRLDRAAAGSRAVRLDVAPRRRCRWRCVPAPTRCATGEGARAAAGRRCRTPTPRSTPARAALLVARAHRPSRPAAARPPRTGCTRSTGAPAMPALARRWSTSCGPPGCPAVVSGAGPDGAGARRRRPTPPRSVAEPPRVAGPSSWPWTSGGAVESLPLGLTSRCRPVAAGGVRCSVTTGNARWSAGTSGRLARCYCVHRTRRIHGPVLHRSPLCTPALQADPGGPATCEPAPLDPAARPIRLPSERIRDASTTTGRPSTRDRPIRTDTSMTGHRAPRRSDRPTTAGTAGAPPRRKAGAACTAWCCPSCSRSPPASASPAPARMRKGELDRGHHGARQRRRRRDRRPRRRGRRRGPSRADAADAPATASATAPPSTRQPRDAADADDRPTARRRRRAAARAPRPRDREPRAAGDRPAQRSDQGGQSDRQGGQTSNGQGQQRPPAGRPGPGRPGQQASRATSRTATTTTTTSAAAAAAGAAATATAAAGRDRARPLAAATAEPEIARGRRPAPGRRHPRRPRQLRVRPHLRLPARARTTSTSRWRRSASTACAGRRRHRRGARSRARASSAARSSTRWSGSTPSTALDPEAGRAAGRSSTS